MSKDLNIGILTHPLAGNYGGMLQAYALHTILLNLGFSPFILDRDLKQKPGKKARLKDLWRCIRRLIAPCPINYPLPFSIERRAGKKFQYLKDAGLNIVHLSQLEKYRQSHRISWIIGSDQVWRGIYARWICDLPYFFLDFATKQERTSSIAYAASFGSDKWEGTSQETEECKILIRSLKAVTVREASGVDICDNVFGIKSQEMPDPTLLLPQKYYDTLITSSKTQIPECDYIASYILDLSENTLSSLKGIALNLSLHLQNIMPLASSKKFKERFPISVPQWLRYIRDCKYLITDSFHGCIFAIIFNKPFVCLGNNQRGNARFNTLLKNFNLQDRLVAKHNIHNIVDILKTPINWMPVNANRVCKSEQAIQFLMKSLPS